MVFRYIIDGALSFVAGLASLIICGLPAWFTFRAVQEGFAPQWIYATAAALGVVGLVLTFAFMRKAFSGVSPTRHRRR